MTLDWMQSKDADHLHTKARHRRRKTAQLGVCILVCKTTAYITLNHRLACTSAHWRHQLRDTEARVPRLPAIFFSSFLYHSYFLYSVWFSVKLTTREVLSDSEGTKIVFAGITARTPLGKLTTLPLTPSRPRQDTPLYSSPNRRIRCLILGISVCESTGTKSWRRHCVCIRFGSCLLYTSPSPRDRTRSRMPSSA